MKIRKRFASILLSVLLAASLLCGCHGSKNASAAFAPPEEFDTSVRHEITFWAKNDTNKTQVRIYENAVAEFEKLYPNIKVNIRLYTDYGKIYNDVITNISTGTTPNVCVTYPDHIATYMTGENVVVPLDDLFEDEKYGLGGSELLYDSPAKDEIVPEFLEECRIGGYTYAIPFMRSTEAAYINKTLVEKLGYEVPDILTWDYVFEVSEAATEKDADGNYKLNGQKVMIPMIYKSTDNMMISMLKQKNAGYSTDAGEVEIFNDTTREILLQIAEHAKTGAFSTFKISSYPGNFLNAGQCLFAIDSTAGATWMGTHAPNCDIAKDKIADFETVVRPIPQYDPQDPKMISQGPSVCIFNKDDPQEVLASWLFAQYLLTNDVQNAYAGTEGYVPVTIKAQESDQYQEYLAQAGSDDLTHYSVKIDAAKMLMANTEHTFVTPVFNGSTSLRDAAGELIEDVTKAVRRKKTVDDAYLDDLFERVTSLYRLDQITPQAGTPGTDLGPMPAESKALLATLAVAWVCIIAYIIWDKNRSAGAGNQV